MEVKPKTAQMCVLGHHVLWLCPLLPAALQGCGEELCAAPGAHHTAGSHCNHTNSYIHLSQLLLGTEGELGLSARDISFPLLVWNRRRLSHGNERKLSKATNLCALRKPPPAALSAAGLTTLFLLHPQTPNIKFTLGLGIFFSCSTIPQISNSFFLFFFSPLSSDLETSNKSCESAVGSHRFGFLLWFSVCPFSGKKKKEKTCLGWNQRRVCPSVQHTAPAQWLCAISALTGSAVMLFLLCP